MLKKKDNFFMEDCSNALMILSQQYETIDRDKNLHITSFQWNTVLEIAELINEQISCKITPSTEVDEVQMNKKMTLTHISLNFGNLKSH